MTLHSQNEFSIPEETARVARAAYLSGNLYMQMHDALGTIYQDEYAGSFISAERTPGSSTVAARVHHSGAEPLGTPGSTSC